MRFEWDDEKSRLNRRKHGISFALAREVFDDPFCLSVRDRVVGGEDRWWSIGRIANLVVVVVVHTLREENAEEIVRIISARRATPRERRRYEEDDE